MGLVYCQKIVITGSSVFFVPYGSPQVLDWRIPVRPPEVTTRNTIFHGETILTVGDGSLYWHQASLSLPCRPYPMRNREDAGRRSEDGEKLRSCKISMCASLKHFGRDTWGNNLIMH